MTTQRIAHIFGWVFIIVAALGFFTSGGSMVADDDRAPHGVLGIALLAAGFMARDVVGRQPAA